MVEAVELMQDPVVGGASTSRRWRNGTGGFGGQSKNNLMEVVENQLEDTVEMVGHGGAKNGGVVSV